MPLPFDQWTAQDAKNAIPTAEWLTANMAFYNGDHWQEARGWSGPMLLSTHEKYMETLARVKAGFVSKNVIAESVDRHMIAVLGRMVHTYLALRRPLSAGDEPMPREQALIDEGESLLAEWWGGQQGVAARETGSEEIKLCATLEVLQLAATTLLLAKRGPLRLFVTPAALTEAEDGATTVIEAPLDESIRRIFIQHPEPAQAAVWIDKATMNKAGVYVYREGATGSGAELAELSYLDEDGNTVTRIIQGDSVSQAALPLSGRLTIYEMERRLLVDEQVRQMQMALNKAMTMNSRNLDQGGFLERLFLNAQMPGTWADDGAGGQTFTPATFQVGAGTANFLSGLPIYDENQQIAGYTTPSAVYRDPVPSTVFIDAERDFYRNILEQVNQLHILISGDATASGVSRIQAKDDFRKSLMLTKAEVDAAVRWMSETVLAMAAAFAGQPGYFDELRIVADCQLDLGIISGEEITQTISAFAGGVFSRETAMRRIGVEDPQAESALIDAEAGSLLGVIKQRAEIVEILTRGMAVGVPGAAAVAGFDDEAVAALSRSDFVEGTQR